MELSEENISSMLEDIPTFSHSVIRILELTADVDCSPKDLVGQITHDPILTAKVLKLVNSAYFGLSRKVDSIQQSVVYVGINTIKSLAISVAAMGALPQTNKAGLNMTEFWSHSLVTAVVAKLLAQEIGVARANQAGFFISGLLHDIGQLIFSQAQPQAYLDILEKSKELEKPLHEIEKDVFGIDHAYLGALLAEKWQLPEPIVEAIRHHHDCERVDDDKVMDSVILVANQVTKLIDDEHTQLSKSTDVPDSIQSWLGTPVKEVAGTLPNLKEEIDNANVFIRLSN